jgi:hypothetical protein
MNELLDLENTIVECEQFLLQNKGKEFKVLRDLIKASIQTLENNVIGLSDTGKIKDLTTNVLELSNEEYILH